MIIGRGSVTKMNKMFDNIHFLQNNFSLRKICDMWNKGLDLSNDRQFTEHDQNLSKGTASDSIVAG